MTSRYQSLHHKAMNPRRPCLLFREWVAIALAMALAITLPSQANAQDKESITPLPAEEKFEGKIVAKELSPEIKLAIDAMRQLRETPGLIMDRSAIYRILDVRPVSARVFKSSDGSRRMNEILKSNTKNESETWRIELSYLEYPESKSWFGNIKIDLSKGKYCYSSRLAEVYWDHPFVYRPLGVDALIIDLSKRVVGRSIGPHDGIPHSAEFFSPHPDRAHVSFFITTGSCMTSISAGQLFKSKEHGDDLFYHQ